MKPIVELISVTKTYPSTKRRLTAFGSAFLKKRNIGGFNALDDISFNVFKGDVIGVIGLNGAGKSTLLQIISGTLSPSFGSVSINGKLTAVLELGSGFDPNFSGKENAKIYLSSLGISKSQLDDKIKEIINFSELENFADSPIRTYSTGMIARLAFSTAICVDPEILVLDEVFAVGDQAFSRKSFEKIKQFIEHGKTIFLCSHSPYHVQMVCNKSLYLKDGKIRFFGPTKDALVKYDNDLEQAKDLPESKPYTNKNLDEKHSTVKLLKVIILKNEIVLDTLEDGNKIFRTGKDTLGLKIHFKYNLEKKPPQIGVVIHDCNRRPIACAGSHFDDFEYSKLCNGENEVKVSFPKLKLLKGNYEVDVFLLCEKGFLLLDHLMVSPQLKIEQKSNEVGLFLIDHFWEDLSK